MATFRVAVWAHVFMALALSVHVLFLAVRALRFFASDAFIWVPAVALAALLFVQLALGAGAWVVNYGWPAAWFGNYAWAQEYTVTQESRTQALITTGHVATGSLILGTSLLVALRSLLLPAQRQARVSHVMRAGVLA